MRLATIEYQGEVLPVVEAAGGLLPLRDLLGVGSRGAAGEAGGLVGYLGRIGEVGEALMRWKGPAPIAKEKVRYLPPVPRPATFRDFYAFEDHVRTCRAKRGLAMEAAWYVQPAFYFSNPLALVGQDAEVYAPANSVELDYELEVAVVIGKGGRDISEANAWEHVAGFTILNDLSARDLQRAEVVVGLGPVKGKDFATAVGPVLVTLDELRERVTPAGRLFAGMTGAVNGKILSSGNAHEMHFTWPEVIAYASRDAELVPGDLIGSGTVGTGCILELGTEVAGGWLKPGDVVELEIEELGKLRTRIVARPS